MLAFLLPVGVYCLLLASINRRGKPVIVSGALDSISLLFACSGFMVATVPMLVAELYLRSLGVSSDLHNSVILVPRSWLILLAYYLMLLTAATLMILWRTHKTMIYNVDAAQFSIVLERTLAGLGLGATANKPRLIITTATPTHEASSTAITETSPPIASPPDGRYAELLVETFPSMCHVTLHWDNYAAETRVQIEEELTKTLDPAAPMDNAAAGWFLSISGLICGVVVMVIAMAAFMILFSNR